MICSSPASLKLPCTFNRDSVEIVVGADLAIATARRSQSAALTPHCAAEELIAGGHTICTKAAFSICYHCAHMEYSSLVWLRILVPRMTAFTITQFHWDLTSQTYQDHWGVNQPSPSGGARTLRRLSRAAAWLRIFLFASLHKKNRVPRNASHRMCETVLSINMH